jgi:predicted RNA-binding protein with PIN domain
MVALVDKLDRWASAQHEQVTVVFERPPSTGIRSATIEVAYAPAAAANSADDEIFRLVSGDARPHETRVVTSDRTLTDRVRGMGAAVHSAHSFRNLIDPATKKLG